MEPPLLPLTMPTLLPLTTPTLLPPDHAHSAPAVEENLAREKKHKADVEKAKRKLESDLKMTQENVDDLEHKKKDLEDTCRK